MDGLMGDTSKMAPLLVRLYDAQKIHGMVDNDTPEARAELIEAVSELVGAELNVQEQELLSDVLIALIRQANTDMRLALSERISVLDSAPLRLVLHLANDEIDVASPIL